MKIYTNSENKIIVDFENCKVEYNNVAIKISEELQEKIFVKNAVFVPKKIENEGDYKMAE